MPIDSMVEGVDVPFSRTVWMEEADPTAVHLIDQRKLPFELAEVVVRTVDEMAEAISDMTVRGAGCIGVSAAYGMYLAAVEARELTSQDATSAMARSANMLVSTRPTAVNLSWAVSRQLIALTDIEDGLDRVRVARMVAEGIANEDVASCRSIGTHGLQLIQELHHRHTRAVNVMTHCNAGWLAFVEYGSATAPIYAAHDAGIPIHVYVGETRPRSQGTLTAWELKRAGVAHTFVVDNAAGHLIQRGDVDLVVVGADRVTRRGDVANKIGTYMRALAARANEVPFYVALPSSTFDPGTYDGLSEIAIEERHGDEVTHVVYSDGESSKPGRVLPDGSAVRNPGFDVTPAELVTGLITERGICEANEAAIAALFPEIMNGTVR